MQFINRMIALDNKMTAVGHIVTVVKNNRVILRGIWAELAVTAGVMRVT